MSRKLKINKKMEVFIMSNILEEQKKNEKIKKYIKYVACYIRVSTD